MEYLTRAKADDIVGTTKTNLYFYRLVHFLSCIIGFSNGDGRQGGLPGRRFSDWL